MVDTVKLILDKGMYVILDRSRFERATMNSARGVYTMVLNPSKVDLLRGVYNPRLTLTHRFNSLGRPEETLAIEFSVPKLIFGNNFNEVSDADFQKIIGILKTKLKIMSILVMEKDLVKAPVSSIHYSKNFPLTDGSIPYTYLNEISKVNMTKRYDLNQTDFRNEGHSVKYHTSSFEIAFYDKMKDMEQSKKSEKRAIEKYNILQLDLFEELKTHKPFEVIRMEIRLNKRQTIRKIVNMLGFEIEPTFDALFKQGIAQKVLLHYMNEIEKGYPTMLYYQLKSSEAFISDFLIHNPKTKLDKAIKALGLKNLMDEVGLRELREILKKYANRSWYRLYKEIKSINLPQSFNCFSILKSQLKKFELLTVASLQFTR